MNRGATLESDPTQDPELGRMMTEEQKKTARRLKHGREREERLLEPTPEGLAEEHEVLSTKTEQARIETMIKNFDKVFGTGPGVDVKKHHLSRARSGRGVHTPGSSNMEHRGMST